MRDISKDNRSECDNRIYKNERRSIDKRIIESFSKFVLCQFLFPILLVFCLAGNAFSIVEKLSVEQMTQQANVIIQGKVANIDSRWENNNGGRGIFTYVDIAVSEYIKGTGDNIVRIKVPGGTVGDLTEWVSDTPQFNNNEEVILFLQPQFFRIVGWAQGKFSISNNNVLEHNVSVADFINMIKSIIKKSTPGPTSALQTQTAKAQVDSALRETPNIGTPVHAVLDRSELQQSFGDNKQNLTSDASVMNEGKLDSWDTIMTEGFEGAFPSGSWSVFGNPTWDGDDYNPHSGSWSAWCANGGSLGLDPQYSHYPNNMNSWMVYGPFSLSDAVDAELLFYYWNLSELNYDYFAWGASTDGTSFYGSKVSGNSGGWQYVNFDLTNVYTLGNLTGQSNVWIAFWFRSDSSDIFDGAFVDDIVLQKNTGGNGTGTNLTPYNPSGWSDKIVVSKIQGTHSDDSPLYATDSLYVDWAVINNGTSATTATYYTKLYVDGVEKGTWLTEPPQNPTYYSYGEDFSIGSLSAGTHAIKIVTDVTNAIAESNESDNEYTKYITIQSSVPTPAPNISGISPALGSAGTDTTVTIQGADFGSSQGSGNVNFFYKTGEPKISAPIISWSDAQIVCVVPTGTVNGYPASSGSGPVTVTTDGGTSNGYNFNITFGYGGVEWSSTDATYEINENATNCTDEGAAVIAAANEWNNAHANFSFIYGGPTTATTYSYNGHNEITWGSTGGSIASTYTWFNASTVLECDVVFNNSYPWGTDGSASHMDVQNIATHELGHWLHLRDLYGDIGNGYDTDKTMYGFSTTGEIKKRTLHADDIAGIQWIYGTACTAPETPSLVSPTDGSLGVSATPILDWSDVSTATSYTVQICYDSGCANQLVSASVVDSQWTVQNALNAGATYYWRVRAENLCGNTWSSQWSFAISRNDLTGNWTSLVQKCSGSKCNFRGTLSIQNVGIADASSSLVRFYLSDDAAYNEGDMFLKQVSTGTLKVGKSKNVTLSYSFPIGISATDKYIIAVIDADNTIVEFNESNNIIVYGPIPRANLTGTWISLTRQCKGTKCKINGTLNIENIGGQDAATSFVRFYLSDDNAYDAGDTFLKQVASGTVKVGKSVNKKLSYALPSGVTASGKYVIAVLDADDALRETDENDNVIAFGPIP